ncbi:MULTISPECIES: SRPBCC domain-containing protein [unclassified Flavobacterium]|uniref:SRPBCC family protein n=1 Tax=unclassified Flavobacterium TaxID=196869 RepID=UPI0013D82EFA|nr:MULTISPECIES: SRPBCC domain-containing protein [unclassified Flavobacterium]MBA5792436.1 SRPBCC domain-containing protein [Flavobacterium sp. xlx-221]
MERIQFTVEIKASAQKVYDAMLGLTNKETYNQWVSAFNPTSTYEGSWDKGSKIYFVGTDEQGKKAGMISEIMEHQPAKFVSIRHYGFLQNGEEITTGEQVEKWSGGFENYSYNEADDITTVTVDLDTVDEYLDYFNNAYPKALIQLKNYVENN